MGLDSVTWDVGLHNPSCSLGCLRREGSSSTGAWRKQLCREVVSGGSSAVKHGTWRKWLHCSSAACREGSSGGRQHLEAAAAQNTAPAGRGTVGGPSLEVAAPPGNGAAGNGTWREQHHGRALPWGLRCGDTPVGTPLWGHTCGDTAMGSGAAGGWHPWRTLARQDGACQQLCPGQRGAEFLGMAPGGVMVQESGTRNGGIGSGASCQELWGRKGVFVAQRG